MWILNFPWTILRERVWNQVFLQMLLAFSMHLGQDMENKQMGGNFAIDVMGTELFSADIYGNEEDFCFAVPEFYEGYILLPTNNMLSAYNASELVEKRCRL